MQTSRAPSSPVRTNSRVLGKGLAAAVLSCGFGGAVSAGGITNPASFSLPGFSTGSLSVSVASSPNNDNIAVASPNTITYSIFFNAGGVGNADLEFFVANSGGTTEYRATHPLIGVVNNTGQPWTGFRFQLGFGVGSSFVLSTGLDALDFDTPDRDPTPSSTVFTTLSHQADTLEWTGGTVPSVGPVRFDLALDVPDNLPNPDVSGISRFTLRLTPLVQATAVPEPTTASLLLAALAGMAGAVRRRKKPRL